jgi:hypothetical protein
MDDRDALIPIKAGRRRRGPARGYLSWINAAVQWAPEKDVRR